MQQCNKIGSSIQACRRKRLVVRLTLKRTYRRYYSHYNIDLSFRECRWKIITTNEEEKEEEEEKEQEIAEEEENEEVNTAYGKFKFIHIIC